MSKQKTIIDKDWKTEAIRRYEEHADVHSKTTFVALMKALQVADNKIASLAEEVMACVGENRKAFDLPNSVWEPEDTEPYNQRGEEIRKALRALFFRHNIKLK